MMSQKEKVCLTGLETPAYLFDEGQFRERFAQIRALLTSKTETSKEIKLCYAAKANPFLLPLADEVADRIEICSQGEMDIVAALGLHPEKVLYSGVCKTAAEIRLAITQGMRHATAESLRHLDLLQQEALAAGVELTVLLRLNSGAQFGMTKKDIDWAIAHREQYSSLQIKGIHYFKGTQRKKYKQHLEELLMLKDFVGELRQAYGVALPQLEYGPGLYMPYFVGEDFSDTLAPIKEIANALFEATSWAEVTVEMGRFFAAPCGTYLTTVEDIKETEDACVVILNGGIHQLTYAGQMMGMKCPMLSVQQKQPKEGEKRKYMLCGSLCTTGDVLVREVELPSLAPGDVIAFGQAGAYAVTEGIGLFLSHPLPAVYLYDEARGARESLRLVRASTATSTLNCPRIEKGRKHGRNH